MLRDIVDAVRELRADVLLVPRRAAGVHSRGRAARVQSRPRGRATEAVWRPLNLGLRLRKRRGVPRPHGRINLLDGFLWSLPRRCLPVPLLDESERPPEPAARPPPLRFRRWLRGAVPALHDAAPLLKGRGARTLRRRPRRRIP